MAPRFVWTTLFFAPAQIKKRHADWGAAGLQQRLANAWTAFMRPVTDAQRPWLQVVRNEGKAAIDSAYAAFLAGRADRRGPCAVGRLGELKLKASTRRADIPGMSTTDLAVPPLPQLTQPLRDLAAWTARFRDAELPVLGQTADALEALRSNEDAVDANGIGEMIASDPLMTLKVLAYASTHRSARAITDVETVTSALVMMGISPFFRAFGRQPTVEDQLAEAPDALRGLVDTVQRAHRGANFALGFAVHRMDPDAPVIHAAALLHDFAEMLLWCHAPALALRIRQAQRDDPALRSNTAQLAVLGIELADLQQALMKSWRLPELLVRISNDRHADTASVQSVTLALRLARHTAHGWDNPAIPDDISDIATLLNLSTEATQQLVRGI